MTKKIPTVRVNRKEYSDHWKKAQGLFQTMKLIEDPLKNCGSNFSEGPLFLLKPR